MDHTLIVYETHKRIENKQLNNFIELYSNTKEEILYFSLLITLILFYSTYTFTIWITSLFIGWTIRNKQRWDKLSFISQIPNYITEVESLQPDKEIVHHLFLKGCYLPQVYFSSNCPISDKYDIRAFLWAYVSFDVIKIHIFIYRYDQITKEIEFYSID